MQVESANTIRYADQLAPERIAHRIIGTATL